MTARCLTCYHPNRADIDVALARGFNCGEVSKKYGLPIGSVQRHKRTGHIPPSVIAAFPKHRSDLSAEALSQLRCDESAGILLNLAAQRRLLLEIQDEAEAENDRDLILRCNAGIHKNVELTARAVGEFAQHERAVTQTANLTMLMTPDYVKLRAGLIAALRPYPAARVAVGKVLAEIEGEMPHFDGIRPGYDGRAQVARIAATPGNGQSGDAQHHRDGDAGD
jgi:hypothetical protein